MLNWRYVDVNTASTLFCHNSDKNSKTKKEGVCALSCYCTKQVLCKKHFKNVIQSLYTFMFFFGLLVNVCFFVAFVCLHWWCSNNILQKKRKILEKGRFGTWLCWCPDISDFSRATSEGYPEGQGKSWGQRGCKTQDLPTGGILCHSLIMNSSLGNIRISNPTGAIDMNTVKPILPCWCWENEQCCCKRKLKVKETIFS